MPPPKKTAAPAAPPPAPPKDACFNCGKVGHRKSDCTSPPAASGGGGGGANSCPIFEGRRDPSLPKPAKGSRDERRAAALTGKAEVVVAGITMKEWMRTPQTLLLDYCAMNKRPRPRYDALDRARDGSGKRYRVVLQDAKRPGTDKDLLFMTDRGCGDDDDHAKHTVALLALHALEPDRPHERKLPEPYCELWKALVKQAGGQAAAGAPSKSLEKRPAHEKLAKAAAAPEAKAAAAPEAKAADAALAAAPAPAGGTGGAASVAAAKAPRRARARRSTPPRQRAPRPRSCPRHCPRRPCRRRRRRRRPQRRASSQRAASRTRAAAASNARRVCESARTSARRGCASCCRRRAARGCSLFRPRRAGLSRPCCARRAAPRARSTTTAARRRATARVRGRGSPGARASVGGGAGRRRERVGGGAGHRRERSQRNVLRHG
jgi:hypothetical protein